MNLSDIKVGDILILGDKIDGDIFEGSPIYRGDEIDTKDNLNYDIYYEQRGGMDYIFQLNKEVYHQPTLTEMSDYPSPFNYIRVDIDKDGDRLKISVIENKDEEEVATENLIMEGGTWKRGGLRHRGMIPRWFGGWGRIYHITPLNPFQDSFMNWINENPLGVKE